MVAHALSGDYEKLFWIAPYRQGKTSGCVLALLTLALKYSDYDFAICGQTLGSIQRNINKYVRSIAEQMGVTVKLVYGDRPHYLFNDVPIYLFGTSLKNSHEKIEGMTIHSAFVDEATLADDEFIEVLNTRKSYEDGVMIYGMNADNPGHFFYEDYIKDREHLDPKNLVMESDFEENKHYPDERREEIHKMDHSSVLYRRKVLNEWVPDAGLVFPIEDSMITSRSDPRRGVVIIDFGAAGVTAALIYVQTEYGWHIADEYTHNGKDLGVVSNKVHIEKILEVWTPDIWVIDWDNASFRADLEEYGQFSALASKEVIPGIYNTNNRLYTGQLTIDERCRQLKMACSKYTWNEATGAPNKKDDHHPDCMRYGAQYTLPAQEGRLLM